MQELGLSQVCDAIDGAFRAGDLKRVDALLWPALDQFSQIPQLWFYAGNLNFQIGRSALAARCFEHCIDLDENPLVLANLGASYRRLNQHENGLRVLEAALDRNADYQPALVNLGSMYVNEGCPEKGIPYLERAVRLGTKAGKMERGAEWNLGLLYLEAGRFREGFDIYRKGYGSERLIRTYGKDSEGIPEPARLETDSPAAGKTLIVWGEQGIGDELMAATIIEEARRDFGEVMFECHPRLEWLHRRAHPGLRIYPTRKDDVIAWPVADRVVADYKAPLLDLAARYRPSADSFRKAWAQNGPTYSADEAETASFREQLKVIAEGRPVVGLATRGGVMNTARTYRTLRVPDADYLFQNTNCLFVGLDYDDMTPFSIHAMEKYGENRYRWFPSVCQHWDFHHVAALVAACDLTVTVCQSVAHLSAGMGRPTRVLTPKRCAWRYAVTENPEEWLWYSDPAVKLYRQDETLSWKEPLDRVISDIRGIA
jgi:tetratricopeptide (TPR) repeat protein